MKKYSPLKKYLVKQLRRNERRMKTKKAKRAEKYVLYAITFIVGVTWMVDIARSALTTEVLIFENPPMSWDVRKEAEPTEPEAESQGEAKDGVSVTGGIEGKIRSVFGEKAEEALIIARCESTLQADRVGDSHLSFEKNGQTYGESYGLFQIRSGGKGWVRTHNVEEFKKEMFTPEKNIETAKKLYESAGGWSPWYNCAKKHNLI